MQRTEEWIDDAIGNEGAERVSESLKINTSLTELNLRGNEKEKKSTEVMLENDENERMKR